MDIEEALEMIEGWREEGEWCCTQHVWQALGTVADELERRMAR